MYVQALSAILLSALLMATASSQPAAKEPSKDKEVSKDQKWPEKIGEKKLPDWLKIAITDKDAAMREQALQVIPNFSPVEVRKTCVKPLWRQIANESDNGVRLVVVDLLGSIGIEDPLDVKDTLSALMNYATGDRGSVNRLHTLQAIGKFGHRAHGVAQALASSELVTSDSSFEVRRTAAHTFGQIATTELEGPNFAVLKVLSKKMAHESALPVRLEALQSLFILGPPFAEVAKGGKPPTIDDKGAQEIIGNIKTRLIPTKSLSPDPNKQEANKQAELWCRLVIIRFGGPDDMKEQLNAIAVNLNDKDETVKYQTLFALRLLGSHAEPKIDLVVRILNTYDAPAILRDMALQTLGAIGETSLEPIMLVVNNTNEELDLRVSALKALAMLGEKAEKARPSLAAIIQDPIYLKDPTPGRIALLQHACLALAAMGVKAQSEVPVLLDLSRQLLMVKENRLKGDDYQKWLNSTQTKLWLKSLKAEEAADILKNQNPEDQFRRFVDDAIEFIKRSTPGHPGGEPKKT